jgi:hypothetical protein
MHKKNNMNLNKNIRWRTVPNTNGFYQVSELGQLRMIKKELSTYNIHNITGNIFSIIPFTVKDKNYGDMKLKIPHYQIDTISGKITIAASTLVFSAFHGIMNLDHHEIFHLDGNELNNSVDNLILCEKDSKKRMVKMYYDEKSEMIQLPNNTMKNFQVISVYNLEGYKQDIYINRKICSRILNIPIHIIVSVMEGNKMLAYEGKIFKQGDGPYVIDTSLILDNKIILTNSSSMLNRRLVLQYDANGNLKKVYNNYHEASVQNNFSIQAIKDAIQKKSILNRCIWILEEKETIDSYYKNMELVSA